jgi:hypothetical protein
MITFTTLILTGGIALICGFFYLITPIFKDIVDGLTNK